MPIVISTPFFSRKKNRRKPEICVNTQNNVLARHLIRHSQRTLCHLSLPITTPTALLCLVRQVMIPRLRVQTGSAAHSPEHTDGDTVPWSRGALLPVFYLCFMSVKDVDDLPAKTGAVCLLVAGVVVAWLVEWRSFDSPRNGNFSTSIRLLATSSTFVNAAAQR